MEFSHSAYVTCDQFVLCKAALIFGVTRWIFFCAHKLVRYYMRLFCVFPENETPTQTSASSFSLSLARENLSLATFGDIAQRLLQRQNHDMSCVVCLKHFRNRDQVWELRSCSHVFHRQCLDRWLHYDARLTCPLCRTSLMTNAVSSDPSSMPQQPSWAVERILYLFGDDLLCSPPYSSCISS